MNHPIASREQWLRQRLELLAAEKELTRQSDAVAAQRQALPWVRLDKDYRFETPEGPATLAGLFRGRSQLLVYHFMFGPDYTAGCPSCSAIADGFDGIVPHLENHDVAFAVVSRAPIAKLEAFRKRMGWRFHWVSSSASDFNADFSVGFSERQQRDLGIAYNYAQEAPTVGGASDWTLQGRDHPVVQMAATSGTDAATYQRERPGISTFVRQAGVVHHCYSSYARGVDALWGMYPWLDRAPLGRNETGFWWRHHDDYGRG